jgi:MFS family permease
MRKNFSEELNRGSAEGTVPLPPKPEGRSVGWIIAATSFAFAVIQLDVTIVNVALPRISADLGASLAELQWVVDAYTLGFAALLISAGVVSDRWGAKHVFLAGFVGFAAASLACGLAPGPGFLNAARFVQGIGAASLVPSSLAILNAASGHDLRLRARAIGIWTAAGGAAIAAGPVVGGLLLSGMGWRSIFLVNLPICAVGLGLTLWCVPPTVADKTPSRSLDLPGQAWPLSPWPRSLGRSSSWDGDRGSSIGFDPPDGGRRRASGSRGHGRLYRGRGANGIANAALAILPAAWFQSDRCFWRSGQLRLLRNNFRSQPLSAKSPEVFNDPSGTRFSPADRHVHCFEHRQWLDGQPNGISHANDPRWGDWHSGIQSALSFGKSVHFHGDAPGVPSHSARDGPCGARHDHRDLIIHGSR